MDEYSLDSPQHRRLLELVRAASDIDFTAYRTSTVVRRIEHRMRLSGTLTLAAYAALVERDGAELARLVDALLIKTTSMFRDATTFAALRELVLPALISRRASEGATSLSVWVVGCSTGEEAYSLAMCLHEAGERLAPSMELVMLASDVDAGALESAARGVLSAEQAAKVPEPLATRWLVPDGPAHRIADELRETIVFARHDVLDPRRRTPPQSIFASFDLVCCRNVLIYLDGATQATALRRLVDVCEPGSILVLGQSETLPNPLAPRFFSLAPPKPIFGLR